MATSRPLHPASSADGEMMHLVIPITPTGNKIISWSHVQSHYLTCHKRDVQGAVWASVIGALGKVPHVDGTYWAEEATISIVRCSNSTRAIDDDNLVTGCKYARDALVQARVVIDDNPGRLRMVPPLEDRRKGHWGGWYGPATHLIVRRVR